MFSYSHTVQYYETDKMGVTHHSNYIRFMEEARIAFMQSIGWSYDKMESMLKQNLTFAEYIKINDMLELSDYYKTDTHWKQENILKIADEIARKMNVSISEVTHFG